MQTCCHCGAKGVEATEKVAAPCPGCGRDVLLLGAGTCFTQVIFRTEEVIGAEEARKGVFVLRTEEREEGLRAAFFWQPPGARTFEDVRVFIDEIVEVPQALDISSMPPREAAAAILASHTFARVAGRVRDQGGVCVLGRDLVLRPPGQ